ncbi:Wzz/FepE/Etk N-terminal domain-containing protein [Azotobacter chroococcum]|uniref:Wzz/FepE/Etk N-terminal domain-containing protein n=1 Tax=Azotobacter chroococcum TaxID=353 RepID=UPI001EF0B3D8|nr:Wzz/FepE/Etk N-terminal domain-containing protein [Azotobacter chroococcum]
MEHAYVNPSSRTDEIDLRELFAGLWAGRLLILAVMLPVALGAAAYAFLASPYYEVRTILRPPVIKDLDELNSSGVYSLDAETALKRVGAALESYTNRLAFFQANQEQFSFLLNSDQTFEQLFDELNREAFTMLRPDPKKNDGLSPYVGISLTYPEGVDGVRLANDFANFAIAAERKKIEDDFVTVVQNKLALVERRIEAERARYLSAKDAQVAKLLEADALERAQLQDELDALRNELRTRRNNRIAQLNEATRIATSLNIRKPTTPNAMGEAAKAAQGNVIRTEVHNQEIPLYFMGTEALEAERDALEKRRSDDFTSPRIAEIQKRLRLLETNRQVEMLKQRKDKDEDLFLNDLDKLIGEAARLRGLKVDFSNLALVKVDQLAVEPIKPVKPKKLLILALGLVLGGMLGVFVALVRGMMRKSAPPTKRLAPLPQLPIQDNTQVAA